MAAAASWDSVSTLIFSRDSTARPKSFSVFHTPLPSICGPLAPSWQNCLLVSPCSLVNRNTNSWHTSWNCMVYRPKMSSGWLNEKISFSRKIFNQNFRQTQEAKLGNRAPRNWRIFSGAPTRISSTSWIGALSGIPWKGCQLWKLCNILGFSRAFRRTCWPTIEKCLDTKTTGPNWGSLRRQPSKDSQKINESWPFKTSWRIFKLNKKKRGKKKRDKWS